MPWNRQSAAREQIVAEKREAIIKEAARAFNKRGYHGTNLEEVAGELGITKTALYYYIKDKESLLLACHRIALDIATEAVALARVESSADDRLRAVLRHYIRGLTDELRGSVVLLEEGALSPANLRTLKAKRDRYERALREIVREGVAEGVFLPCDERIAVFTILGAVNWISKWYSAKGARSSAELAEMISTQLVRGLMAEPRNGTLLPSGKAEPEASHG